GDDDSTRVHQPYASEPTQMVSAHDIIEGQALSNLMSETPLLDEGDDFDSAPTRVAQGRVDPRKAVAATLAAKRAATARAAKRAVADQRRSVPLRPPLESSHKILDTESTDPEVIAAPTNSREAIPAIPLPDRPATPTPTEAPKPEEPGASYLGPALNVPGNTNDVIAPMFAKASHTPTVFSPPATYNPSGNRRMLLAASVFVLGVCALMLMVVLYLLLPSEPTQPIATAEPEAASSNLKGSSAAASPADAPKANTPSPNKGDDSAASPSKDSPSKETPSATVASATGDGKEPAAENSEDTPAKTEGAGAEAAESETAESDAAEDTAPEAPTGPAVLTVASEPKGASVYVDGRFAGLAPVELTQSDTQGTVTLLLKKEGYREERQVVQYEGSRTVEIALKSTAVAHKQESPAPTTQDSPADHNEKAPVAEDKAKTTAQTQTATQTKVATKTKTTQSTQAKTPKKPAASAKTTTTAAKPKRPTPKKPKTPKKPSGKKAFEKW
ncbi:MAG: PEGA domain-containing protein, partial [Myxococcota bacterium]